MIKHSFFSWQLAIADKYLRNLDKLHHSLIIHGLKGIGKFNFAISLSSYLLCENPTDNYACGSCKSCNLIIENNHPDLKLVIPEFLLNVDNCNYFFNIDDSNISKEIKISQIRDIIPWISITPYRSNRKVVLLYKSDYLNIISSNALLKMIEEPPINVFFIIVSDNMDKTMPTIISRCQVLHLPIPDYIASLNWLKEKNVNFPEKWLSFSGNAPIDALYYSIKREYPCPTWIYSIIEKLSNNTDICIYDIVDYNCEDINVIELIDIFQKVFFDIILSNIDIKPRYFIELEDIFKKLSNKLSKEICINIFLWLGSKKILSLNSLNKKMLVNYIMQKILFSFK